MDRARWEKKETKTIGSHDVVVTTQFLSNDYSDPCWPSSSTSTNTGELRLMLIEPNSKRLKFPSFSARWDHADNSVDIDLEGNPTETRKFAEQRLGYRGHKTTTVSPGTYAIDIETPSTGRVFKGTLKLNIDLGVRLVDNFPMADEATAVVRKVRKPTVSWEFLLITGVVLALAVWLANYPSRPEGPSQKSPC